MPPSPGDSWLLLVQRTSLQPSSAAGICVFLLPCCYESWPAFGCYIQNQLELTFGYIFWKSCIQLVDRGKSMEKVINAKMSKTSQLYICFGNMWSCMQFSNLVQFTLAFTKICYFYFFTRPFASQLSFTCSKFYKVIADIMTYVKKLYHTCLTSTSLVSYIGQDI